jgi:hypothetical protein
MTAIPKRFAEATKVPVVKTRGEIEAMLGRHKCQQFGTAVDYLARKARVQFLAHDRIVRFIVTLPDPARFRPPQRFEQEERRIWRSLLLVIKAKLESVASGIATFEEEFLAQIVMPNDQTVADLVIPHIAASYARNRLTLPPASEEADK